MSGGSKRPCVRVYSWAENRINFWAEASSTLSGVQQCWWCNLMQRWCQVAADARDGDVMEGWWCEMILDIVWTDLDRETWKQFIDNDPNRVPKIVPVEPTWSFGPIDKDWIFYRPGSPLNRISQESRPKSSHPVWHCPITFTNIYCVKPALDSERVTTQTSQLTSQPIQHFRCF